MGHSIRFDGELYDMLSAWAVHKEDVYIQYTCNEVIKEYKGRIQTIFKNEGMNLLLLSNGTEIRIDRID